MCGLAFPIASLLSGESYIALLGKEGLDRWLVGAPGSGFRPG